MKQYFPWFRRTLTIFILAFLFTGCRSAETPAPVSQPPKVNIIVNPEISDVLAGHTVALAADVSSRDKLTFTWSAIRGTLSSIDAPAVNYTAPETPGADIVTVVVSSTTGTTTETISFNVVIPPTETSMPTAVPTAELGLPMIADFDNCTGTNNLGGAMGSAYPDNSSDSMMETYLEEAGRGCVARLEYHIKSWSAFWSKLQAVDLVSPYKFLAFDIKGDPTQGIPAKIKLEGKHLCDTTYDNCEETSIKYISGITAEWQTIYIELDPNAWEELSWTAPLSSFEGMGQLVFTVEADGSGTDGVFYLDNIKVVVVRE